MDNFETTNDRRYTITQEYTGAPGAVPHWVARFIGTWIGSDPDPQQARLKAERHYLSRLGIKGTFDEVEQGAVFFCNGNLWRKRSIRTAAGIHPDPLRDWSYFHKNDPVRF